MPTNHAKSTIGQGGSDRDCVLHAACNEGRFPPARLEHYRRMWDKDPEGTRTLLTAAEDKGGLAKGVRQTATSVQDPRSQELPAGEAALLEASRVKMGGDLRRANEIMAAAAPAPHGSRTVPGAPRTDGKYDVAASTEGIPETPRMLGLSEVDPPESSSSAPPIVTASGIAVDAYGGLSYQGLPVSLADDGTPRVHVSSGPMTIETLRSLGIDLEQERLLYASRVQMGAA